MKKAIKKEYWTIRSNRGGLKTIATISIYGWHGIAKTFIYGSENIYFLETYRPLEKKDNSNRINSMQSNPHGVDIKFNYE